MNPMSEGENTLELQHSNSGYVRILPGTAVKHVTDFGHMFDLLNSSHAVVATVQIESPKNEL